MKKSNQELSLFNALISMCEQYLAFANEKTKWVIRWSNCSMQAGEEAMGVLNDMGCLTDYNGAVGTPNWEEIERIKKELGGRSY